jgi:hypothetical protein
VPVEFPHSDNAFTVLAAMETARERERESDEDSLKKIVE